MGKKIRINENRMTVILTPLNRKWVRAECAKLREIEGTYVAPARVINALIREKIEQQGAVEVDPQGPVKPVKRKANGKALEMPGPATASA